MTTFDSDILNNKKHIHFIGIGGSGMFPLAQILHSKGFYLTGSDINESDIISLVRELGIKVYMKHDKENIKGADLIIYSAAIMKDNPEILAAKENGVPLLERSELLGIVTQQFDNCICVCGTHGKTTTTSMITHILFESGFDPSAVIGGKLKTIGGYGRVGRSDIMICEACEFVDTFLKLSPDVTVILNIDEDHLDYFKTLDNIIKSFNKFADMTSKTIIVNGDDENSLKAIKGIDKEIIYFGLTDKNDYYPDNINYNTDEKTHSKTTDFDLIHKGKKLGTISLHVVGIHNVLNAVAACAAALNAGASFDDIASSLSRFYGAGRRLEILGIKNGITIADDYAHHPAELKCTLEAVKSLKYNNIWAVFQPFTFSRTAMLLNDFVEVLKLADKVVLSPIMGSREINTYNIYSKDLGDKIEGCVCLDTFEQIADYVITNAKSGDIVITLGCGDIYKAAKLMLK